MNDLTSINNSIKLLMTGLHGRDRGTQQEIKNMFYLHNQVFPIKEHSTTCSSCVSRVFKKMQNYYNLLIANERADDTGGDS